MKFSTKGRYSLETMVYLVTCKSCCSLRSVSEKTGISSGYLEQLMIPLKQAGLVVSERGVQGGYRVARTGITCLEVFNASEGDFRPAPCQGCDRTSCCKTCATWKRFRDEVNGFAQNVTLESLASHLLEPDQGGGI
jgi:Rrf2 family protein